MTEGHAVEPEQGTTGKTLKRWGILAVAAAAVAGIVAKQTSQPVAAGVDGDVILGSSTNTTITVTKIINNSISAGGAAFAAGRTTLGIVDDPATRTGITAVGFGPGAYGVIASGLGTDSIGLAAAGDLYGVYASTTGGSAANTRAVQGINTSTAAGSIGVYGQSNADGSYGVVGTAATPSSIGIGGMAYANGSSAFSGGTANANAYAGYFQGHVVVAGSFDVSPLGNKHGVAPHPDGTHRTFYSVESPECWVEDFGTGTLAGGKADVRLDADFAALTHTDDYHVFLTGVDDHHHLIAKGKTAKGFTVEADGELAKLKGKKATELTGTFSYRVVAKPKTTAKVERLAKATLPNLPLPPMPKSEPPKTP